MLLARDNGEQHAGYLRTILEVDLVSASIPRRGLVGETSTSRRGLVQIGPVRECETRWLVAFLRAGGP
jgi:hypothetical protein